MRMRNILYVLPVILNAGEFNDLSQFMSDDDFNKLDLVLSSEPNFDIGTEDEIKVLSIDDDYLNTPAKLNIPSVHTNPLDISIDNIVNPLFTEQDTIIPTENLSLDADEKTENTIDVSSEFLEQVMSTEPEFTESEVVPTRTNEEIPELDFNIKTEEQTDLVDVVENVGETNIIEETNNLVVEVDDVDVDEKFINDDLTQNNWIKTANDLGNSWYEVDWFGYFYSSDIDSLLDGGWIFHISLGWVYISPENVHSTWIWSDKIKGWIWTSSEFFPYANLHSDFNTWLYFDIDKSLVYDYNQKKYFDFNAYTK